MTASASASTGPPGDGEAEEFHLVESPSGWKLTITLTDRLREALANGGTGDGRFGVRIAPNLVPGEPFQTCLAIQEPAAHPGAR